MLQRGKRIFMLLVLAVLTIGQEAGALSLALDSIAEWGRFPRFCVNTYRWGDKFFNTYDTAYVEGTGYKFNVKAKSDMWADTYIFELPNDYTMYMRSDMCTSLGAYVTYLALSVGYDLNVSQYINGSTTSRKRFGFKFNCALLSADFYWISNDVGTTITRFGRRGEMHHYDLRFTGINTRIFGVDAYYHFNNKRYSRAAAFNYSKIQKRSQGSFYLGFSYWEHDFSFDFSKLPDDFREHLPESWAGNHYLYTNRSKNYSVRVGYGYNWVFHKHWLLGVSESPILGLKTGSYNGKSYSAKVSLYNRGQLSLIWNNKRWFAGAIFSIETGLFFNKENSLLSNIASGELSLGYRFNLW